MQCDVTSTIKFQISNQMSDSNTRLKEVRARGDAKRKYLPIKEKKERAKELLRRNAPRQCGIYIVLRRSVRSCSHTIPEKVRNSRPINMGFEGWE